MCLRGAAAGSFVRTGNVPRTRTRTEKMRGNFRTALKYGISPAEQSPCGKFPPPVQTLNRQCTALDSDRAVA